MILQIYSNIIYNLFEQNELTNCYLKDNNK